MVCILLAVILGAAFMQGCSKAKQEKKKQDKTQAALEELYEKAGG